MNVNDGGPAFPVHPDAHRCGDAEYDVLRGMTMRNYFAGQVIGHLVSAVIHSKLTRSWKELAEIAFAVADEMVKESRKT